MQQITQYLVSRLVHDIFLFRDLFSMKKVFCLTETEPFKTYNFSGSFKFHRRVSFTAFAVFSPIIFFLKKFLYIRFQATL